MDGPVRVTVDGRAVEVPEGATVLSACDAAAVDTPTLCWDPNLEPQGVCRVCVVEVDGSRALVPACERRAVDGMVVHTDTDRVRHSRRMVLELLAASTDLSAAPDVQAMVDAHGARPQRWERRTLPAGAEVKVDNDLYVRAYDRCVQCFKCVVACGDQAQWTFAIAVGGRGADTHITTEYDVALPDSACVYCGNCIEVCPTGALMAKTEFDLRSIGRWVPDHQTRTDTICGYCGVGCEVTVHVQDERIVKVTSPHDSPVTRGNLCVKGRFAWGYVQAGTDQPAPDADPRS